MGPSLLGSSTFSFSAASHVLLPSSSRSPRFPKFSGALSFITFGVFPSPPSSASTTLSTPSRISPSPLPSSLWFQSAFTWGRRSNLTFLLLFVTFDSTSQGSAATSPAPTSFTTSLGSAAPSSFSPVSFQSTFSWGKRNSLTFLLFGLTLGTTSHGSAAPSPPPSSLSPVSFQSTFSCGKRISLTFLRLGCSLASSRLFSWLSPSLSFPAPVAFATLANKLSFRTRTGGVFFTSPIDRFPLTIFSRSSVPSPTILLQSIFFAASSSITTSLYWPLFSFSHFNALSTFSMSTKFKYILLFTGRLLANSRNRSSTFGLGIVFNT